MIDEKKLIERFKQLKGPDSLANMFITDVIKEIQNQPQKECSECSRRKFYQLGYKDGVNAEKKDHSGEVTEMVEEPCATKEFLQECKEVMKKYKKFTNADRIRNMTYEELADFLHNIGSYVEDGEPLIDIFVGEEKTTISDNFGSIKEWLQAEVKEGNYEKNT